jgi:hypothetical protein
MMRSVLPSGRAKSDGIGYCSAVSIKLMPLFKMDRSISLWHIASSGALKSAEPQRCVPRPISLTMMSPPPRRFWRIPSTTPTISLVAPPLPFGFSGGGAATAGLPKMLLKKPPDIETAAAPVVRSAMRRVEVAW